MAKNKVVYGGQTIIDLTDTTATASDVAQGKYFYGADGVRTTGTASGGGGGASNFVTGTFKGTTANSILTIALPYTGSGYPIDIIIHPVSGWGDTSSDFGTLVQRYALALFVASKQFAKSAPNYSANIDSNKAMAFTRYKSDATIANSYSNGTNASALTFYNTDPGNSSSGTYAVRICSNKQMKVLIAGTSYGFAANIEYAYQIVYSS